MPARSALAFAILLGFAPAAAADNVDWNQYIEKPGTTYTSIPATRPASEAKAAPGEKAAPKTVAAKPRTKAKAKAKAPVKARRKH